MHLRICCLLVAALLCLADLPAHAQSVAAPGMQDFDEGMQRFQAGNYAAALQSFLDAQHAGLNTPGLHYNLGTTYYRLARYTDAEREFLALVFDSRWSSLAHYDLGLTTRRLGRREEAIAHFEEAYRTSTDPGLRTLAAIALERLGRPPPARNAALVSLAGGYDSNVGLSPNAATVGVSHQSDVFLESLAAASLGLTGNAASGSYGYGGLIVREYRNLHQFDLVGLRLGLSHDSGSGRLRGGVGVYFDASYVGGNLFERAAVLDLQARARLEGGGELRGRYQFEHVLGGSGFEYLSGRQQRLSAQARFSRGDAQARVGYELELNDRKDLDQGGDFISYSPTRHSLFAAVVPPGVGGWRTEARGEYRLSRYNDPYLLNGGTLEVLRKDDRYGLALRASHPLSSRWNAFIDYSYYRNASNLDTYDYARHQVLAGFQAELAN
jgi:hypothetical protein